MAKAKKTKTPVQLKPLPFEDIIKETITKEKNLKLVLNSLKIQLSDDSPLDVSYLNEVLTLMGLPEESDLKDQHQQDWDKYIGTYTAMVYGDITIDEGISQYQKDLAVVGQEYNPKNHKPALVEFLTKEQDLFEALKLLGVKDSGPLADLTKDWKLATALIGKSDSDELNDDLFKVIEKEGNPQTLVKKWVK